MNEWQEQLFFFAQEFPKQEKRKNMCVWEGIDCKIFATKTENLWAFRLAVSDQYK